ncbi:hypothetical protein O1L60_04650 [Streptomyces diastatochromogenes]|nr:hypothetical protein [Streptomyces diastatochromogenes]
MNDLPTATVHNSVGHLRADAWSSLTDLTHRLAAQGADGRPDTAARIRELIDLLTPIEHCWAFPGTAALKELRGLHDQHEYRQLAHRAEELYGALAGHRHRAAPHTVAGPGAAPEETADPAHPSPRPPPRTSRSSSSATWTPPRSRRSAASCADCAAPTTSSPTRSSSPRASRTPSSRPSSTPASRPSSSATGSPTAPATTSASSAASSTRPPAPAPPRPGTTANGSTPWATGSSPCAPNSTSTSCPNGPSSPPPAASAAASGASSTPAKASSNCTCRS